MSPRSRSPFLKISCSSKSVCQLEMAACTEGCSNSRECLMSLSTCAGTENTCCRQPSDNKVTIQQHTIEQNKGVSFTDFWNRSYKINCKQKHNSDPERLTSNLWMDLVSGRNSKVLLPKNSTGTRDPNPTLSTKERKTWGRSEIRCYEDMMQ